VSNPLAEALAAGRFCYVVELVASRLRREAQVLAVASGLARLPEVVAGSVTSYAGGALGHDPVRVATAVRARGLTPNVHLTCASQDRAGLRKTLEDLAALGLYNVFALTGDWPRAQARGPGEPAAPAVFDLDSVQLVRLIADLRRAGMPFHVSVAVSPFKYVESDLLWQYLKLEKKVAAGADLAITQVGWDARKFAELRRWVDERGLGIPLLGNVYVLGRRAAEKMAAGEPPGCWVSPALLETVRRESQAPDGGLGARLERAARMVAVLRGLGYAGAYLGGTHEPAHVAWIIRRAEALVPRWRELAAELDWAPAAGFYLYGDWRPWAEDQPAAPAAAAAGSGGSPVGSAPSPPRRGPVGAAPSTGTPSTRTGRREWLPRILDALGRSFPVSRETALRGALRRLFATVDRSPALARAVERIELAVKRPLFGCQACGNCVLGNLEYVCPQTCPKQMRNGPCGGAAFGRCEVVDQPCIWGRVYERARAAGRVDDLRTYIPPPDRSLQGTSSWINYFLDRDSRPGREKPWASGSGPLDSPISRDSDRWAHRSAREGSS
jgi:methylenetetrahydrofolate reductase (NADPH)